VAVRGDVAETTGFEDDPLDSRLGTVAAAGRGWRSHRRLSIGLSPTPRLGLILLPLGVALGPRGLDLLSERVLTALDPAVSAGLAALGVLIGLQFDIRRRRQWTLAGVASLGALFTALTVAGGLLLAQLLLPTGTAWPWTFALLLGACAAPSSSASETADSDENPLVSQIADLDDLAPIVLGFVAFAWLSLGAGWMVLAIVVQTAVIAAMIAVAGVLLVTETASENEQRVFVIGTILLLAGAAAHLQLSELFTGLVAGIVFKRFHAVASLRFERDLRYLQHPLVALLFLVAGARVGVAPGWPMLVVVYVAFRTAGKLFAGRLSGRWVAGVPRDAGVLLLAPGVVGVALALNASRFHAAAEQSALLFAIVVAGSIVSEVLSLVATRQDSAR
jgi:hypothetical protein